MEFYDEFDHIGYNLKGEQIVRPTGKGDHVDQYLARHDDPNFWYFINLHKNLTKF